MIFIPKNEVIWRNVRYLKEPWQATDEEATWGYDLILPEPLASWGVFSTWEADKTHSIEKNLKKGDILFDYGVEQCWLSVVYAHTVGAENMVLIEPTREFWPGIQATWQKNFGDIKPKATLVALASDRNNNLSPLLAEGEWPSDSEGDLIDRNKYQYIHDNGESIPEITTDYYVSQTGIIPDALALDTEGYEHIILKGAENTLKVYKPKLFLSLHPDLAIQHIGTSVEETIKYLESLGYRGEFLGETHEQFWYFEA